jgi:hypothetical protein
MNFKSFRCFLVSVLIKSPLIRRRFQGDNLLAMTRSPIATIFTCNLSFLLADCISRSQKSSEERREKLHENQMGFFDILLEQETDIATHSLISRRLLFLRTTRKYFIIFICLIMRRCRDLRWKKRSEKSLDSPPQNLIITLLLLSLIWI